MPFKPIGGFPSIIRLEDATINTKTLESRGFSTTNIVSISSIMDSKKKENLISAFGTEEEEGLDFMIDGMLTKTPHKYDEIDYKKLSRKKPSSSKKSKRK